MHKPVLSILIPSITSRGGLLSALQDHLEKMASPYFHLVEVLVNVDNGEKTVGQKRNELLAQAEGAYIAFIDDDDWVSDDYMKEILLAIVNLPDCIGMEGYMTTNGTNRKDFKISKELEYKEDAQFYYRPINHLCPVKREIALQIGFPRINSGEDFNYCMTLKKSGLLKKETYIAKPLYHYRFDTRKTATQK